MPADAARRRPAGLPRRHRRPARGRRRARRRAAAGGRRGRRGPRRARARVAHLRADRARLGALGARGGAGAAIAEHRPRAVLYSSTTAALLRAGAGRDPLRRAGGRQPPGAPRRSGSGRSSGGGWRARRCWCRGARAALAEAPQPRAEAIVVPVPVAPSGPAGASATSPRSPTARTRRRRALDRVLAAWARGAAAGRGARRGRASTAPPAEGVRFTGMLPRGRVPRAAAARARRSSARPRREDYGIAQLEALADGCVLVTTPSPGPYAALPAGARARPAARSATTSSAAIRIALDDPAPGYAERALEALAPWRPEAVDRVVAEQLLPRLQSLA